MNWDHIAGSWEEFSGSIQQQWNKLNIHQLKIIAGNRDLLKSRIQESYGISKSAAEQQLDEWQEQQSAAGYLIERATERNGGPQ